MSVHSKNTKQSSSSIRGKNDRKVSGDFGAPESDATAREYASHSTRAHDKGNVTVRSGSDGKRTAGVGGNDSGPGSSSGGDLDTDIVGVGTDGTGLAASPPGKSTTETREPNRSKTK